MHISRRHGRHLMLIRTDAARGLTLLCRFRPPVFFNLRQLRPFQAFERSFRFYAFVVGINVGSVAVPKHVRFCGGFCSVQIQLSSKLINYSSVDPKHDFVIRTRRLWIEGSRSLRSEFRFGGPGRGVKGGGSKDSREGGRRM